MLEALIGDQPQSDLIPKLVRGLLGGRKRGRWLNTQENVFILLALDRYFHTYEKHDAGFRRARLARRRLRRRAEFSKGARPTASNSTCRCRRWRRTAKRPPI